MTTYGLFSLILLRDIYGNDLKSSTENVLSNTLPKSGDLMVMYMYFKDIKFPVFYDFEAIF
jgi:hypothetical protein